MHHPDHPSRVVDDWHRHDPVALHAIHRRAREFRGHGGLRRAHEDRADRHREHVSRALHESSEIARGEHASQSAAFIDSGSQYSIGNMALKRQMAGSTASQAHQARVVSLHGVNGRAASAELALVDEVRLGGTRLGPMPLLFSDLYCFNTLDLMDEPAILIGADILGRFRNVSVDFTDNRVIFEGLRAA